MTTLFDLIHDTSEPVDRSESLQDAFKEAFDLEGWEFAQLGSIPYGTLHSEVGPTLSITAIQNGGGLEWQLNGVSFLFAADADLDLETRRMRLVDAARRAGYIAAETTKQVRSKS